MGGLIITGKPQLTWNPFNHIVTILDNFPGHRTENVAITTGLPDIRFIFLPPYHHS